MFFGADFSELLVNNPVAYVLKTNARKSHLFAIFVIPEE